MSNKSNEVSFQTLKQKYALFALPDEVLLSIYEEACQKNADEVSTTFYKLLLSYIKKNMSYEIMKSYLYSIVIDSNANVVHLTKKLHSFFNFLDAMQYNLTIDDALALLEEVPFQLLFEKKFSGKSEVSLEFYESFVGENSNLELLCNLYMDEHTIEIVESRNDSGSKSSSKLLSRNDIIELVIKAQNGDCSARDKAVQANLGLVRNVVARYSNYGVEFDDLVQEGMFGLMAAIEHFDHNKGCAFSTYAIWWIRQAITRALSNQARTIRVPVHVAAKLYKINKAKNELKISLDHNPTISEIAAYLKTSPETIQKLLDDDHTVTSLQCKINADGDSDELEYFLEDERTNVSEEVVNAYTNELLLKYMKEFLTDKEFRVLCYRFGLENNSKMTLEEVSKIFGLSRERIRQIESKALKKLGRKREVQALEYDNIKLVSPLKAVSETPKYEKFDISTIHPEMNLELFLRFVDLFPPRLKKIYCSYRSISIAHKRINSKKVQKYDKNIIIFMDYVEQLLKEMYRYYMILIKKNLTDEVRFQKLIIHMEKYSLLFRYADYTFKEIRVAVKKLRAFEKNVLHLRYGANLYEFHDFPKDDTKAANYYATVLCLAHTNLKNYLEHPELEKKKREKIEKEPIKKCPPFLSKYPNYTIPQVMEFIHVLPIKYQKIIYLRNGDELDCVKRFPKDKKYSYYYNLYTKALKLLDNEINGISKVEKKGINTLIDLYSKEDLKYALSNLNPNLCEIVYLRHGKELEATYSFPKPPVGNKSYYYNMYNQIKKRVSKILKERKERVEHSFVNQLGDYSVEEVFLAVTKLDDKDRNILFLKRGENLDQYLPWPNNKPVAVYNQEYKDAIFALKKVLNPAYAKRLEELETERKLNKNAKKVSKSRTLARQSIIQKMEQDKLAAIVKLLPEKQKEAVYLRHGKNLDTTLPFPSAPENRSSNYYYSNYAQALKKIDFLSKDDYYLCIPVQTEKRTRICRGKFLNEVEHDILVQIVENLPNNLKEVLYLRHGKNLDTTLPFPPAPENRSSNYYMSTYFRAKTRVREILNGQDKKTNKKVHNSKKSMLNKFTQEDLIWAMQFLSESEKEFIYLRHTKSLDVTIPWPDESSKNQKYYNRYHKIVVKINHLLEQKNISLKEVQLEKNNELNKKEQKKEKKEDNISKQYQELVETKAKLNQMKLQNSVKEFYEQFRNLYGRFIPDHDLKIIFKEAVESYSYEEGLSIDLAIPKKMEIAILLQLSNQYKENPDSEESLEILLLIEEIFGSRLKERYTHANYCYLSDEQISRAIEETFQNYTGRLPYYVELSLKIKKQGK